MEKAADLRRATEPRRKASNQGTRSQTESTKAKILTGYGTEKEESNTSNWELNRKRGRRKKCHGLQGRKREDLKDGTSQRQMEKEGTQEQKKKNNHSSVGERASQGRDWNAEEG